MASPNAQPPSIRKRARLAAAGVLPYEPAAVHAAALVGVLLLVAASGEGWFDSWRALVQIAVQTPGDLAALGRAAADLGLRAVGGLLAASLLCGWGVGWLQRRLSPPVSAQLATDTRRTAGAAPTPRWFALLLAVCATATLVGITIAASGLWYRLHLHRLEAAKAIAGVALLLFAACDIVVVAVLTRWRHHRFDREQAMSRAEQREEAKDEATPQAAAREMRAQREAAR